MAKHHVTRLYDVVELAALLALWLAYTITGYKPSDVRAILTAH